MSETTKIEWTDATVNFWWGCTKIGPGCDHCYAEAWAQRFDESLWGVGVPRRKVKSAMPTLAKLHRGADRWEAKHWRRRRVFLQSMSDLFDKEVPDEWFAEAWTGISMASRLELQIVTKRISFVEKRLAGRTWPQHAGLIISVVNQEEADRDIPRLLDLKSRLGIPWVGLSMEPLLGPVDVIKVLARWQDATPYSGRKGIKLGSLLLDWVIVGGESGPSARPMHPDWARSLRDQCAAAGVPFMFKQWGEFWPTEAIVNDSGGVDFVPPIPIDASIMRLRKWEGNKTRAARRDESVGEFFEPGHFAVPLGKKDAGRLLDGVEHNGFPQVCHG